MARATTCIFNENIHFIVDPDIPTLPIKAQDLIKQLKGALFMEDYRFLEDVLFGHTVIDRLSLVLGQENKLNDLQEIFAALALRGHRSLLDAVLKITKTTPPEEAHDALLDIMNCLDDLLKGISRGPIPPAPPPPF